MIGIGNRIGKASGISLAKYWSSLISATVETAAPTHLLLTFPAPKSVLASDFAVSGNTVVSGSWTGNVYTLVLGTEIFSGFSHTVNFKSLGATAITNNVALTTEYNTVLAAMGTAPSAINQTKQNRLVKRLINAGSFDKAELIDVFATHSADSALINWKNPGTFNPTTVNSSNFTQYKGQYSDDTLYGHIKTNFIPSSDGTLIDKDSMCMLFGMADDAVKPGYMGATDKADTSYCYTQIRFDTSNDGACYLNSKSPYSPKLLSSKKHLGLNRITEGELEVYCNYSKHIYPEHNSVALVDNELFLLGFNLLNLGVNGRDYMRHYSYFFVSAGLTETEMLETVAAFEEYLSSVGTPLIETNPYNLMVEGHSFVIFGTNAPKLNDLIADNTSVIRRNVAPAGLGTTIAQLAARSAITDGCLSADHTNILVVWTGVNDVTDTAGTGTTAYNALKAYTQARLAAGWDHVLLYTMTPTVVGPRGAGFETERQAFNGLLRSDLDAISGVHILDTDTIPQLCDSTDATYFADGLHPNQVGEVIASNMAIPVINTLI